MMVEQELLNYFVQNSFAIAISIYLLYERATLTKSVVHELTEISKSMTLISAKLGEVK